MIDAIAGFIFTPLSVVLFLNVFGVTNVQNIFGVPVLLLAAVALIILQIANILGSHIEGHSKLISYSVHILSALPSFAYFLSLATTLPSEVVAALPLIFACFIFLEGLWSLFVFT